MMNITRRIEHLYVNSAAAGRSAKDNGMRFIERVLVYLDPEADSRRELSEAYSKALEDTRRDGVRVYSWGLMAVGRILDSCV